VVGFPALRAAIQEEMESFLFADEEDSAAALLQGGSDVVRMNIQSLEQKMQESTQ
jgi:hypothetical protein